MDNSRSCAQPRVVNICDGRVHCGSAVVAPAVGRTNDAVGKLSCMGIR